MEQFQNTNAITKPNHDPAIKQMTERERGNLEDGGGRADKRERRLNAAGRIGGESSLNKLALQIVGARSGGFKVTLVLLCGPFSAFASANESENSHLLFFLTAASFLNSSLTEKCAYYTYI